MVVLFALICSFTTIQSVKKNKSGNKHPLKFAIKTSENRTKAGLLYKRNRDNLIIEGKTKDNSGHRDAAIGLT